MTDRFAQSSCWLCDSPDAKGYTTEYGWYEESVTDVVTSSRYIKLVDGTVHLCASCLAKKQQKSQRSFGRLILILTAVGAPLCLAGFFFFGFFDWMMDPVLTTEGVINTTRGEWVFAIAEHFHASPGAIAGKRFELFDIVVAFVWFLSFLMLILPAVTLLALPMRVLTPKKRRRRVRAGLARDWAVDMGTEELKRQYAGFNPVELFRPNATEESDAHYWIGPKMPGVDSWERQPMPRRHPPRI